MKWGIKKVKYTNLMHEKGNGKSEKAENKPLWNTLPVYVGHTHG